MGMVQVSAGLNGVTGETTLTVTAATLVTLEVMPTNPSIALGTNQPFTATGIFTDGSKQDLTDAVSWTSSDAGIAAPSANAGEEGLALSAAVGTATITADFNAVMGSSDLTVTAAAPGVRRGLPHEPVHRPGNGTGLHRDRHLHRRDEPGPDRRRDWSSDTAAVATVDNAPGTPGAATSAATGATTITADVGGIAGTTTLTVTPAALVSIDVSPAAPAVPLGLDQTFTAWGVFTDGSSQDLTDAVTWSSSDTMAVQVSNAAGTRGLASTLATGTVTVTATQGAVAGSTDVTVTPAALVSIGVTPATPSIALGTTVGLVATGVYTDATVQDLTDVAVWTSSSAAVATVSNAAGSTAWPRASRPARPRSRRSSEASAG